MHTRLAFGLLVVFACQAPGPAQVKNPLRSVKYIVEGTVHSASLTYKTADGATEQHDVQTPFSVSFMQRAGETVYLSAQKKVYEVMDQLRGFPRPRIVDDGVKGTVVVRIEVSGTVAFKAESSAKFGIATASGTLK